MANACILSFDAPNGNHGPITKLNIPNEPGTLTGIFHVVIADFDVQQSREPAKNRTGAKVLRGQQQGRPCINFELHYFLEQLSAHHRSAAAPLTFWLPELSRNCQKT